MTRALRDAGMEVVYTGLFQTPKMIARAARDEDVDVVGLSILSGAHNVLAPRVVEALNDVGLGDVLVVVGGTIPARDVAGLKRAGIQAVFGPGTPLSQAIEFIETHALERQDTL
jgi:methylmalonyl-CoA mutase, C-terminal domain